MKLKTVTLGLLVIFTSITGCKKEENTEPCSVLGIWEVIGMTEDGIPIQKENPTDSIGIEFQNDGLIIGSSSRNLIAGQYKLFNNDSIWISYLGGTEIGYTRWERKFRTIMPIITFFECNEGMELVFYSSNRMSQIIFYKHLEL